MTLLMDLNLGLAGLNAILALGLGFVYWRNHRDIRSPFTLALMVFALFLLFHNSLLLYHYVTMMDSFYAVGDAWLLAESVLQAVALSALLWATWR